MKIFFFGTTGPISTKVSKEHPWVMTNPVSSNGRPRHFPRGNNNEIQETILTIYKKKSPEPLGKSPTNLDTKHPWMKECKFVKMNDRVFFGMGRYFTKKKE